MISGMLVASIGITSFLSLINGPGKKQPTANYSYTTSETTTKTTYQVEEIDSSFILEEDDFKEALITDTPVSMAKEDLDAFKDYLSTIEPYYEVEKLLQIDKALESEKNYVPTLHHEKDIRSEDGHISLETLFSVVKKNNAEYYDKLGPMQAFYDQFKDDEIRSICKFVAEVINEELKTGEIDSARASCFVANLKIYKKTGPAMAAVNRHCVLSINPKMVKVGTIIGGEQNTKRNLLIHEIKHMLQYDCLEHEDKYMIGISYRDESLEINPLFYSWLLEASAEKEMMNDTGDKNIIYAPQIGYMETLGLAFALDNNYKVGDISKVSMTWDREKFYSWFGLSREEIIKMMYTIEIIQAEPDEFKKAYEKAYNEELTDEKLLEIKMRIKGSFCESVSKIFYRNLADRIAQGNVTLEDTFYLIKIFESDMFSHLRYDSEIRRDRSIDYLKAYKALRENFFSSLKVDELPYESIEAYFDDYSMRITLAGTEREENYSLQWLDEEKKVYIYERKLAVYSKNTPSPVKTLELVVGKTI